MQLNCELTENRLRTEDLISNTEYKELVKNNMNEIYVSSCSIGYLYFYRTFYN